MCCIDQACRRFLYSIILFIYWLIMFCAGYSCVQKEWSYLNSSGNQASQQFRCEGAPGRWHLCAPHFCCKHSLVVAKRPALLDVTVANGKPMLIQVIMQRAW